MELKKQLGFKLSFDKKNGSTPRTVIIVLFFEHIIDKVNLSIRLIAFQSKINFLKLIPSFPSTNTK